MLICLPQTPAADQDRYRHRDHRRWTMRVPPLTKVIVSAPDVLLTAMIASRNEMKIAILDRRQFCYISSMEPFLITFNIVVSLLGFSFMAWSQRDTRQILRELKELMG